MAELNSRREEGERRRRWEVLSDRGDAPLLRRGPIGHLCRVEYPSFGVEAEAEVGQAPEVDGGDPVASHSWLRSTPPVTDPAVAAGDEPGDGALDHGPVLTVGVGDFRG